MIAVSIQQLKDQIFDIQWPPVQEWTFLDSVKRELDRQAKTGGGSKFPICYRFGLFVA